MQADDLIALPQYSLPQAEKTHLLAAEFSRLSEHHRDNCEAYRRILAVVHPNSVDTADVTAVPWLPVHLFKSHELRSIPAEAVFKTLTSSGTTSSGVSRILLDADSAARQTRALASIMTCALGPERLPMIIVDSRSTIRDRRSFSARGAGILGMATFGRDHFYALDDAMQLDRAGLHAFLETPRRPAAASVRLHVHGLAVPLRGARRRRDRPRRTAIARPQRRLEEAAGRARSTTPSSRAALRGARGTRRGCTTSTAWSSRSASVFLECEDGLLHAPNFADVIIRDPDLGACRATGSPASSKSSARCRRSYPGHSLLTEDLGVVLAEDDCALRQARASAFAITGRVPQGRAARLQRHARRLTAGRRVTPIRRLAPAGPPAAIERAPGRRSPHQAKPFDTAPAGLLRRGLKPHLQATPSRALILSCSRLPSGSAELRSARLAEDFRAPRRRRRGVRAARPGPPRPAGERRHDLRVFVRALPCWQATATSSGSPRAPAPRERVPMRGPRRGADARDRFGRLRRRPRWSPTTTTTRSPPPLGRLRRARRLGRRRHGRADPPLPAAAERQGPAFPDRFSFAVIGTDACVAGRRRRRAASSRGCCSTTPTGSTSWAARRRAW